MILDSRIAELSITSACRCASATRLRASRAVGEYAYLTLNTGKALSYTDSLGFLNCADIERGVSRGGGGQNPIRFCRGFPSFFLLVPDLLPFFFFESDDFLGAGFAEEDPPRFCDDPDGFC